MQATRQQRDFDLTFDQNAEMRAFERKDADGTTRKYLRGTASSTVRDLMGSVIGPECQVKMLGKLKALASELGTGSGMTGWLNHSYRIPEDTLGCFTSASLVTRDKDGESFIDLDIECRVTETNPRAIDAYRQVKDGIRHGWSIGAVFLDIEWEDPDDWWNMDCTVLDIDLLETSLVGIPANQRAWCRGVDDLRERVASVAKKALGGEIPVLKARSVNADRNVVRGQRELVRRSFLGLEPRAEDGIADTASTSPITRNEAEGAGETTEPPVETGTTTTAPDDAGTQTTDPPTPEPAADPVPAQEEPISPDDRSVPANDRVELGAIMDDMRGALASLQAGVPLSAEAEAVIMAAPQALQATLSEIQGTRAGAEPPVDETPSPDVRALDPSRQVAAPQTELSEALRGANTTNPVTNALLAQAADAIDVLTLTATAQARIAKRDMADGDGQTPDDYRDQIGRAMGHIAKSVGHGVCIRGGQHLSKALDCLSMIIGTSVDQPGPNGTETEGEQMAATLKAEVEKLSPAAGDVVVIRAAPENAVAVRSQLDEIAKATCEEGVMLLVLSAGESVEISKDGQAAAERAVTLSSEVTSLESKLVEARTAIEQAEARLAEIDREIEERGNRRLGRRSLAEELSVLPSMRESEVRPEHYDENSQRAALARMASDNANAEGRDLAITR